MMYCITLGLILYIAVSANAAFQNCGSKVGDYNSVTVSNCNPDGNLCILTRGQNVTIAINFSPDKDVKNVKSVVHGIIAGVPIPFSIAYPNACQESGLTCPLTKDGGPYNYKATLYVEKLYPKLKVDVRWELKNENNEDIVCVLIPAKLQ